MQKSYLLLFLFFVLLRDFSNAQSVPSSAHIAREHKYDVQFYFLDLDIEKDTSEISGNVLIRAASLVNDLDTFSIELGNTLTIDSVKTSLDGASFQDATSSRSGSEVNIELPFTATVNQSVEVRIFYHGSPALSDGFLDVPDFPSGFFGGSEFPIYGHGVNSMRFSASPPYNAYTWFPCKQDLTDKADSSWFFITTDSASRGISNGLLTNTVTVSGNKKRWEWKSHHPISYWLISFVVGDYTETTQYWHPEGRTDSMVLKYYNYTPSPANRVTNILNIYSKLFGLYPFYDEKLGIAKVDLGGGVENQTIVSLGALGSVEAHEIAHQWFACNVTCGSWKSVMLNEGFARWSESVYDEFSAPTITAGNTARIQACAGFENSVIVKSPTSSINNMSDSATAGGVFGHSSLYYDKGAMIINSLRFEISNDSLFFLGLRNYQEQFRGKHAVITDLISVMQNTTGMDFTEFFGQWYYGYGFPTFKVLWNQQNDRLMLKITQTTSSANTPLFKTPLEIKARRASGDTTIRLFISQNVSSLHFKCAGTVTSVMVDPNQWIINDKTVTKDTTLYIDDVETISSPTDFFTVFPNPASDYLVIKSSANSNLNKPTEAELFNMLGEKIYYGNPTTEGKLTLPKLSEGVYFLRVNKTGYSKILITH